MTDRDPIQLSYSRPRAGPRMPMPAVAPSGPAAAAMGVVGWTIGTVVVVGIPGAVAILSTLGPGSGFAALIVLVVLLPLMAVSARGIWNRYVHRLMWGHRERGRRPLVREAVAIVVNGAGWTFLATLYLALPMFVLLWATGPALAFPGLVLLALVAPLMAAAVRAARRRRAMAVLGYLEQAVRLNQPFVTLLAAAAQSEQGRLQRRLEDLYLAVQGGMSLADGLSVAVPEVSPRAAGMVAFGESTGQLPAVLRRLVGEGRRSATGGPQDDRAFSAWYPPLVVLVVVSVTAMLGIFVLPKFEQIFHDFRLPLPRLTRMVFGLFDHLDWAVYLLPVFLVLLLVELGGRLRLVLRDERESWLKLGPWDRVRWYAPVLGRAHRDRNLADLCDALADAVEQGFPLVEAVSRAQRLGLNTVLLTRVSMWAGGLDQGVDVAMAARAAKLPPLLGGLVSTADPTDGASGLRFAARFYAGRHAARWAVLSAAYTPAVTLVMGLVVATVALALILPIRDLIERVEPYMVGL